MFEKRIQELPAELRQTLRERYASLTLQPEELPFIERIVAGSRQVALNHTAGLSTSQQVQMALFPILSLLDSESAYKELTKRICRRRKRLLYEGLEMTMTHNAYDASGGGFHGPEWSVRVSLANLEDQAYFRIGRAMKDALQGYVHHSRSTFP
ncbi:hypothetical protein [Paenibacillus sp. 1001270B_150601_E10]|uniref:hypothetical protein n=1 Tax=Paenibacillus sp. 1001270B_150601_E10 TaxID=2787079 RepID=UPI001E4E54FB|nr:hypothetical protein [Paenibacillus sp. 1001270B_150601_E10]